jgi:gag-polypeptide of LTR copia-type
MRCARGGEVRALLGSMRVKREELAAVGVTMSDKEYRSAIIMSLPEEMSKFASSLLTAARVLQSTTSIDPDTLIDHISEEADRLAARRKRDQGSSGKEKQSASGTQDEVMAATQGDGGKKKKKKGNYHNCGKQGHWARDFRVAQERTRQQQYTIVVFGAV